MRTTILTEQFLPNRSTRGFFSTSRRSRLSPAQIAAAAQAQSESKNSAQMLVDARDFVPSDYPCA